MSALARTTFGFALAACALAVIGPRLARIDLRQAPETRPAHVLTLPDPTVTWTGIEIPADRLGHYQTEVRIDGFVVPVLVDTGATFLSLSAADAQRIGLRFTETDFKHHTATANGIAAVAMTTLHEVQLGNIRLHDVKATVHRDGLSQSLLGMSFLSRLSRVEAANGRLILRP